MTRIAGVVFHLSLIGAGLITLLDAAAFTTPYTNTFDTTDRTNDFAFGRSPTNKSTFVIWTWQSGLHKNTLNGAGAGTSLSGWATLDFSGPGGIDASIHDFNMTASLKTRHSSTSETTRSGGYQGLCALATDTNLTDYYYGSFIFTNVVGTLQIARISGGVTGLAVTQALTIAYSRDKTYGVGLQGVHQRGQLILTLNIWDGPVTNSVSLTDPSPLSGSYYGYRDFSYSGSPDFWWDNLTVTSSLTRFRGSLLLLK